MRHHGRIEGRGRTKTPLAKVKWVREAPPGVRRHKHRKDFDMAQILMDGTALALEQEPEQVGQLFDLLRAHVPSGRIISHVYLDEREVLEQEHNALRNQALASVQTVRVVTATLNKQVFDNIGELLNFLRELRPVLRQASRELRFGAVAEATTKLADCFTGMDTAVRNIEQLVGLLPTLKAGFSEAELSCFSRSEIGMFNELTKDFSNKDWLGVADRLEFQVDPLMGRWQTVLSRVSNTLKLSSTMVH